MRLGLTLTVCTLLAACSQAPQEPVKEEPIRRYELHGEVLRLDGQGKIAAIKHEQIGDWMGAMTMEFPVKEQQEFDKLRAGEKINATVFVQGASFWVGEIREDTAPPAK